MKYNTMLCRMGLIGTILCAVFSVCAKEAPEEIPSKYIMRGGLPYEEHWKEKDVKAYLKLPYDSSTNYIVTVSATGIARKLQQTQSIGKYQIGTNETGLVELQTSVQVTGGPVIPWQIKFKYSSVTNIDEKLDNIVIELYEKDNLKPAFYVTVYDAASWNSACDDAYVRIVKSASLWNSIPEFYKVNKTGNAYVINNNGSRPRRWHFDLKNRVAVYIDAQVRPENAQSRENAEAEIDQLIQDITELISVEKPKKEQL